MPTVPIGIPPGWIQFPSGDWGPPNIPPAPGGVTPPFPGSDGYGTPPLTPGDGGTPSPYGDGPVTISRGAGRPVTVNGNAPGASLNTTGPDIYGPNRSNVGTGKELTPWQRPTLDDSSLGGLAGLPGGLLSGILSRFGPYGAAAAAAGKILWPTPAETGEAPRQTLGRSPSGPGVPTPPHIGSDANYPVMGAGGFPTTYAAPGQQPAMPSGPLAAPWPSVGTGQGPFAGRPMPSGTAGGAAGGAAGGGAGGRAKPIPASDVDLGRFVTIPRANAPPGPMGRGSGGGPMQTALNLSNLFGPNAAAAPAVNPNAPAPAAQNVSARPPVTKRWRNTMPWANP